MTHDPIAWYDSNLDAVGNLYEGLPSEAVLGWMSNLLPTGSGLVLDVGAGTGRDAVWLVGQGFDVVAVEPSKAMRKFGQDHHPSANIRWVDDRLPGLDATIRMGLSFDVILLSAVWMHLPTDQRPRAFRKLLSMLRGGGILAMSLRHGEAAAERGMHPTSLSEIETLARAHGATVERSISAGDALGRDGVTWTHVVVRLPDDGTGALPLLRHVVLSDAKSSTYKLALLRAVARIADSSPGMARAVDDDHVSLPLGLVALYWLRLFKPLLAADLPQTPTNRGGDGLGFVGDGFRAISSLSHLDLRIGMVFGEASSAALHRALEESCRTIVEMPARYMTYPNDGGPIMPGVRRRARYPSAVVLDEAYLSSFGELVVPRHLWRALARFDAWIEPAIVSEWGRLMRRYAERQGRLLDPAVVGRAMAWSDPARDVSVARAAGLRLMESGTSVHCVWTGKRLSTETLDMDHAFPWSAWPCDDLWNLLPAARSDPSTSGSSGTYCLRQRRFSARGIRSSVGGAVPTSRRRIRPCRPGSSRKHGPPCRSRRRPEQTIPTFSTA
jgi:SAM-dependent methyltransferase